MSDHNEDNNDIHHWSLDKRFNVGHFLTTIIIAGMLFAWASNVSERVSVLERNDIYLENRLDREMARSAVDFSRVERRLEGMSASLLRIEDKLDKKEDKNE